MQEPSNYLRLIFYTFVRVFLYIALGFNVRRKNLLPKQGPAIVVANHNSHLDTMVLISLFPLRRLPLLRPVAAADHFLRNKWMAWFSSRIVGIIPIVRGGGDSDPLRPCQEALHQGKILILFPEGSRGEPERMSALKKGIAHLAADFPTVPVIPVFMHGLGKALPRNESLLVPFFCDVFVGESLYGGPDRNAFMANLKSRLEELATEENFQPWD